MSKITAINNQKVAIQKLIEQKVIKYFGADFYAKILSSCSFSVGKNQFKIISSKEKSLSILQSHYKKDLENFCLALWPNRKIKIVFQLSNENGIFDFSKNTEKQESIKPVNDFLFSNFITEDENIIASKIAESVCKQDGIMKIPSGSLFYLHGSSGTGKTHLSHAVNFEARCRNLNSLHYSAEKFTSEYVNSVRYNKIFDFKNKIHSCDLLIVDDFEDIIGKKKTFQELSRCLAALIDSGKIVMLTSSSSVKKLDLKDRNIKSYIESSIIAELKPATKKLKQRVIANFATKNHLALQNSTISFLAESIINGGIRAVKGALQRLKLSSKIVPLNDFNSVKEVVRDLLSETEDIDHEDNNTNSVSHVEVECSNIKKRIKENSESLSTTKDLKNIKPTTQRKATVEKINSRQNLALFHILLRCVAIFFNVKQSEILSRKKSKTLSYIRGVLIVVSKNYLNISLREVIAFSKIKTSTVYNLYNKINKISSDSHVNIINSIQRIFMTMKKL